MTGLSPNTQYALARCLPIGALRLALPRGDEFSKLTVHFLRKFVRKYTRNIKICKYYLILNLRPNFLMSSTNNSGVSSEPI